MMGAIIPLHSKFGGYILVENFVLASIVTLLFICLYVLKTNKWNKEVRSKQRLPGPGQHFLGSIANIFALRNMTTCLKTLEKWGKEYGPIVRCKFGPFSIVVLNSPEYVQKLLSSNNMHHLPKGPFYEVFRPVWNDGIGISKGQKWKERRRVLNKHMFSATTLQSYVTIFNQEGDNLVSVLEKMFPPSLNGGEEKEIEPILMHAVLNVIAKAAFGKSVSDFENIGNLEDEPSFTKVVDGMKRIVAVRIFNPWLLSNFIWRLHPMSKYGDLITKTAWKYAARAASADDKLEGPEGSKLGIQEDLMKAGVPLDGILEESITLLSTGYETTSSSLHFTLFLLAQNPEHQEHCRKEIDSVYEDESLCPSGIIQYAALGKLNYVKMCVNETLRLLPTVFATFRKIEAPLQLDDDIILPAGSNVGIFAPGIHKNPDIYPEPDKFLPQRFSAEEIKKRHPYAHIPFSGGPRACIGYKFAMMEIGILIAKILRHYVISTTDRLEDVVFLPYITLTPQTRMKFCFKRRSLPI